MPRVAGDNPFYTWRLCDAATGLPVGGSDTDINLPSVTSIINESESKPALVPWAFREGLRAVVKIVGNEGPLGLHAGTEEELVNQMEEFGLSTQRVLDEASERGKLAHSWLESLGEAQMQAVKTKKATDFRNLLVTAQEHIDPFVRQVAGFYEEMRPQVVAVESRLRSMRHHYAGTMDLLWTPGTDRLELTDLKTRKDVRSYESDKIQIVAYGLAWEEMHPDQPITDYSVLIASPDDWNLFRVPPELIPHMREEFLARRRLWEASGAVKQAKKGVRIRGARTRGKGVATPSPDPSVGEGGDSRPVDVPATVASASPTTPEEE